MPQDPELRQFGAERQRRLGRPVARAVVHEQDLVRHPGQRGRDVAQERADVRGLVPRGQDHGQGDGTVRAHGEASGTR